MNLNTEGFLSDKIACAFPRVRLLFTRIDAVSSEPKKSTDEFTPTSSTSQFTAILDKFVVIEKGRHLAKLSLLSGKDEKGEQIYLSGSFIITSKSINKMAALYHMAHTTIRKASQSDDYKGGALPKIRCQVEIGNIHHEEPFVTDDGRILVSYRGFLNKLSFG